MDTCSFCRGPFHIASGDIVGDSREGSKGYRFCGACILEMRKWMKGHLNRKWSKQSFYAHASVPPSAVEVDYVFTVYVLKPGEKCTYTPVEVEGKGVGVTEADALQHALSVLSEKYPDHHIAEHTRGLWRKKEA